MTTKTTRAYPYTREDAENAVREAETRFGANEARGPLSYRREGHAPGSGATLAFTFVESPRTAGAYREIPFA